MTDRPLPNLRPDVPHAADREIGETVSSVFPEIVDTAFESHQFLGSQTLTGPAA